VPSIDGSDNLTRIGGPGEELWRVIVLLDETQDCRLQFSDGSEDAAFEPARVLAIADEVIE
jgi:hypothetical protein